MNANLRFVLKFVGGTVFVILLLALALKYVFLDRAPSLPETSTYAFDLPTIRALAEAPDRMLPLRINLLDVAQAVFPRTGIVAGEGFGPQPMHFVSVQVVYPDTTYLVDAVHNEAVHGYAYPNGSYDAEAFATMQAAMRKAHTIIATHEHFDHVGGIGDADDLLAIRDRVVLTRDQLDAMRADEELRPIFPLDTLALFTPLDYGTYHALAPGMVLIKAAGHTPGSQMIYVRLRNGREYLLVGDVVWNEDNIRLGKGRPLLIALMGGEDRDATAHQLRTLMDLEASGDLTLVIAHDPDQHQRLIDAGLLGEGFE